MRSVELAADRGSIFDRNGNDLSVSIPQRTVWADPSLVADPLASAAALSPVLGLSRSDLEEKLQRDSSFVYLARRAPDPVADEVEALGLDGIYLLDEPSRIFPSGDLARGLLGDRRRRQRGTDRPRGAVRRRAHRRGRRTDPRTRSDRAHDRCRATSRRAGATGSRPRAHHRSQLPVRDRAAPGPACRRDRCQGWHGRDRPPRDRRDPRHGEHGDRPRDRRGVLEREQRRAHQRVRARIGEQDDHLVRRPRRRTG